MRDIDDIINEAYRWLADRDHPRPFGERGGADRYAPLLIEALTHGPLDDDTLMEALDECTATGDALAARLVGHLLALAQDDRDTIADALQARP